MEVETWLVDEIERFEAARDAPALVTLLGPRGLTVRVEVDWFEGDDSAAGRP
jgi:hypothetical protein